MTTDHRTCVGELVNPSFVVGNENPSCLEQDGNLPGSCGHLGAEQGPELSDSSDASCTPSATPLSPLPPGHREGALPPCSFSALPSPERLVWGRCPSPPQAPGPYLPEATSFCGNGVQGDLGFGQFSKPKTI